MSGEPLYTRNKGKIRPGLGAQDPDDVTGTIEKGDLTYTWKVEVSPKTDEKIVENFAAAVQADVMRSSFTLDKGIRGVLGTVIELDYSQDFKKIQPYTFTQSGPGGFKRVQSYNGQSRSVSNDVTLQNGIPVTKEETPPPPEPEEGLSIEDKQIGLWYRPNAGASQKYAWYALNGSRDKPVSFAATSEALIETKKVKKDLNARGMKLEKNQADEFYTFTVLKGASTKVITFPTLVTDLLMSKDFLDHVIESFDDPVPAERIAQLVENNPHANGLEQVAMPELEI